MQISMFQAHAVSMLACFCTLASARRLTLQARVGEAEFAKLESQTYQTINDVESHLQRAYVEFKSLAEHAPAKTKVAANHTKKGLMAADIKNKLQGEIKNKLQGEKSMLENLFKHLKNNIANFNKEEKKGKDSDEKAIEKLKARLQNEKASLKSWSNTSNKKGLKKFDHDLLVNNTRMDEIELKYRMDERTLGHQMFHTNLKMTHGLMSRVKNVLAAYAEAFAKGHVDAAIMKKVKSEASPEVFAQLREQLKQQTHLRL